MCHSRKLTTTFLFILCYCTQPVLSQDSSHIRVALLTVSPGEELYSTFGHTGIRIIDSSSMTDIVYNYGTFDFNDEFYINFMKGKLRYYISWDSFIEFKELYRNQSRGITEQVLFLEPDKKIALREALNENLQEKNKYYKYDFFFDNCTTRPRDLLKKFMDPSLVFHRAMPVGKRFREAIHEYLEKNNKHWSKLGIDILLGGPTDAIMTDNQDQFLPDNLMISLTETNKEHHLLESEQNLYSFTPQENKTTLFTPLVLFSFLLVLILGIGLIKTSFSLAFLSGFSGMFFFLTGLLGILLVLMWTATDHAMCRNNYNLLWAWPTHLIMAFFINSRKKWARNYFRVCSICMIILLVTWFILPQQLNPALIPILLMILLFCMKNGWNRKNF